MKMKSKQDIRRQIGAKRGALDPRWVQAASTRIIRNLQALEAFQSAGTIALYMAIGGEVNLDPIFPDCWKSGKRTYVPVFNAAAEIYEMAEITYKTDYIIGHYGIREPISLPFAPWMISIWLSCPGWLSIEKATAWGAAGAIMTACWRDFTAVRPPWPSISRFFLPFPLSRMTGLWTPS